MNLRSQVWDKNVWDSRIAGVICLIILHESLRIWKHSFIKIKIQENKSNIRVFVGWYGSAAKNSATNIDSVDFLPTIFCKEERTLQWLFSFSVSLGPILLYIDWNYFEEFIFDNSKSGSVLHFMAEIRSITVSRTVLTQKVVISSFWRRKVSIFNTSNVFRSVSTSCPSWDGK